MGYISVEELRGAYTPIGHSVNPEDGRRMRLELVWLLSLPREKVPLKRKIGLIVVTILF